MRDTDSLCKALGDDRYLVDGRELSLPMAIAELSLFAQMFAYVLWRRAFGPAMPDLPKPEAYFATVVDILVNGLKGETKCA